MDSKERRKKSTHKHETTTTLINQELLQLFKKIINKEFYFFE